MKSIVLLLIMLSFSIGSIKEDFNSLDELKENWWISQWGQATKQYDASMVSVDSGVLQLSMLPDSLDNLPRPLCGEVVYNSAKVLYGSFRASIKTTKHAGGVVGWFVYKDGVPGDGELHEVDMEILTEDLTQIQYTLHHDAYSVDHIIDPLHFDPSEDFHEYRFDWYPDSVVYYIDGVRREKLTVNVPDDSCLIMLNYWSNNSPNWGGKMPNTLTHMWVDYMHYYSQEELTATPLSTHLKISNKSVFLRSSSQGFTIHPPQKGTYQLSIFQINGKLVYESSINSQAKLNKSLFSEGVFIVQLEGNGEILKDKIVVK